MVTKVNAPEESADAVAARERAEAAAEKKLIGETTRGVSAETAAILRRFGIKAAMSGSAGAGGFASGGFGGSGGTASGGSGSGGSFNPAAFVGSFGGARAARNTSIQQ